MKEIKLSDLLQLARPGDIGLSENPDGIGKTIKRFQELQGDEAKYTHAFIFSDPKITIRHDEYPSLPLEINKASLYIYEAYKQITSNPLSDYFDKNILVMRHRKMDAKKYLKGVKEIEDNLGDVYPYHRLMLHAVDSGINWLLKKLNIKSRAKFAEWLSTDWPVCSELAAQFLLEAGVKTKLAGGEKWQGVQPDDLHDAALRYPATWEIVFEGKLIDG